MARQNDDHENESILNGRNLRRSVTIVLKWGMGLQLLLLFDRCSRGMYDSPHPTPTMG